MTARRWPVLEFPIPMTTESAAVIGALDQLREALGRVSSLVDILMYLDVSETAIVGAGGSGTLLTGSSTTLDFDDAKADTFRVVAYGEATAGDCVLVVRDVGADRELCRVAIPLSAGRMQGEWTPLPAALGGERSIEARVIGNGVAEQTLVNVHLQARTTHFR